MRFVNGENILAANADAGQCLKCRKHLEWTVCERVEPIFENAEGILPQWEAVCCDWTRFLYPYQHTYEERKTKDLRVEVELYEDKIDAENPDPKPEEPSGNGDKSAGQSRGKSRAGAKPSTGKRAKRGPANRTTAAQRRAARERKLQAERDALKAKRSGIAGAGPKPDSACTLPDADGGVVAIGPLQDIK